MPDSAATLFDLTGAIVAHRSVDELMDELAARLKPIAASDFVIVFLHDDERNLMRLHLLGKAATQPVVPQPTMSVDQTFSGHVWKTQEPLLIPCLAAETRFPEGVRILRENGVASAWYFPLTTPRARLGAIGFASLSEGPPAAADERLLALVAKQVALAVEGALDRERAVGLQKRLAEERDRLRLLLEVNRVVASELELGALVRAIDAALRRALAHEYIALLLHDPAEEALRLHTVLSDVAAGEVKDGGLVPLDRSTAGRAFTTRQPAHASTPAEIDGYGTEVAKRLLAEGVRSICSVPLVSRGQPLGALSVGSHRERAFDAAAVELIADLARQIAPAVDNALAYAKLAGLNQRLAKENVYLEGEIHASFGEIVGESDALKRVLAEVATVAVTDSTVLIGGETGTGKELIARAIHSNSGRRDHTFVKLNCSAIPTGLLESELFGHEKGAFTGAVAQKVGRFEFAHKGTLFLDEVGDIPLELQPKLLRVLQEQEFERLGSTRTIKVDVRLVAATNRDLAQMVTDREFRSDLYYRLNVFPVSLPPLRERADDVARLARHFVDRVAARVKKRIDTIPSEALDALRRYSWPGNIRELENVIERAVILSTGPVLYLQPGLLPAPRESSKGPAPAAIGQPTARTAPEPPPAPVGPTTLRDAERDVILKALQATNWKVAGPAGAAARLGINRSTLQTRMQKLGITRPQ